MAKHNVKCFYCGRMMDINSEKYIKINARRYAHIECAQQHEEQQKREEEDLKKLLEYVKKLFKENNINLKISKQIEQFKNDYGYTYSGILKTLIWWYEIKENSIEKANGGLGIVPYVYEEAKDYYYHVYMAQEANKDKDLKNMEFSIKEINIESPRAKIKPNKMFNLGEEE